MGRGGEPRRQARRVVAAGDIQLILGQALRVAEIGTFDARQIGIGALHIDPVQFRTGEVGPCDVGEIETGIGQVGAGEMSSAEIGFFQIHPPQICLL